jgi:hypothetical protein
VRSPPGVQPVEHEPIEEAVSSVVVGDSVEDPFERWPDDTGLGVGERAVATIVVLIAPAGAVARDRSSPYPFRLIDPMKGDMP